MSEEPRIWRFEGFSFDAMSGELRHGEERTILRPQTAALLSLLLEADGELVTHEAIRARLWAQGRVVEYEVGVPVCVREIRQALGDDAQAPRYVKTHPRRGYQFMVTAHREAGGGQPRRWQKHLGIAIAAGIVLVALGVALLPDGDPERATTRMLAVMPFETLSDSERQESLGYAVADEIITRLAPASDEDFAVIARSSILEASRRDLSVPELGEALGAALALEGSVMPTQEGLSASARLLRTTDGAAIWGRSFEVRGQGVASHRALAANIARAVLEELAPEARARDVRWTEVEAAERAYLEGRLILDRSPALSDERFEAAEAFRRAFEADPSFAPAYSAFAEARVWTPEDGLVRFPEAQLAALKALALDPELAGAHRDLAITYMFLDHEWDLARRHFQRALELNPGDASAHTDWALYLASRGRMSEAVQAVQRARRLDPLSGDVFYNSLFVHYLAGDVEALLAHEADTSQRLLSFWTAWYKALALSRLGRLEEAKAAGLRAMEVIDAPEPGLRRLRDADPETAMEAFSLGMLAHVEQPEVQRRADPVIRITHLTMLGREDEAIAELKRLHEERDLSWALPFLRVHPAWEPLRSRPEYQALISELGLRPPDGPGGRR